MEPSPSLPIVFTNVSQLFYCLSLLGIAGMEWRLHQELGLPPWLAMATGCLLAGISLCLLVWSAVEGMKKLASARQWVPFALLAGMYVSIAVLAAHAFPSLILRR